MSTHTVYCVLLGMLHCMPLRPCGGEDERVDPFTSPGLKSRYVYPIAFNQAPGDVVFALVFNQDF